jgi:hypothetical protein
MTQHPDPRKHLESLLIRGEMVHWSGGPEPHGVVNFARRLSAWVPLGFGVALFALAAVLVVLGPGGGPEDQTPLAMALFGGLALLYGASRALIQARALRRARGRFYAVTDRRVIVVDGGAAQAIVPHALRGVVPMRWSNGTGDLIVLHSAGDLDTRADDATLTFQGVMAVERAAEAVETLARKHGVDISDEAA